MIKKWQQVRDNKWLKVSQEYFLRADISNASATIAYYSLLALFPAIIALGAILPFLGININNSLELLKTAVPNNIYQVLTPIIRSVLARQSVGLFSVGIIITLWSLSKVVAAFRQRLDVIYNIKKPKSPVLVRIISMAWLVATVGLLGLVIIIMSLSRLILEQLTTFKELRGWVTLIQNAKWPIVCVVLVIGVMILNYALPAKRPKFKWALLGSSLEVGGFLGLSQLFGLYVNIAAAKYSFYQAIGTFIILLIWLNLVASIALIGATFIAILNHVETEQHTASQSDDEQPNQINENWGKTRFLRK